MKMSNEMYDLLHTLAIIVLPALAAFYGDLAELWGLPFSDKIPQTLCIFISLIGALLKDSSAKYYKKLADEVTVEEVVDVEDIDHQLGDENGDSDKG